MPKTCENWLSHINIVIYYAHQTPEIYQVLPTQWFSKLLRSFEIHWVRQYLVNIVLFRIKDM